MLFGNKNKKKNKNIDIDNSENRSPNDIEVVVGDDSDLEISDVGDYMNSFRPKSSEKDKKKNVVIPKVTTKNKTNKKAD